MKRIYRIITVLLLCSILVYTASCNGKAEEEEIQEEVIAIIQRGDLSLDIAAVGNLALSEKETLNFELAGTVTDVLIEEGDSVEEGQILAKLDTSEREEYLKSLSKTIELKDQALLQAEINFQNGEKALAAINSQSYLDQKKAQAGLDVISAETALVNAEDAYEIAEDLYEQNWTVPERIRNYEQKKIQLTMAELNLAEAEETLTNISDDIAQEIEIKEKELVIVKSKLEDAQKEYDDAVSDVEEAQIQSWDITAPFDGYITKVSIVNGQAVQKSTAAVEIANPNEFVADVSVSEMDISNITVGTTATVQIDAMESMILPAEVVKISPTANIQSGVVNYTVKVKISSLNSLSGNMTMMRNDTMDQTFDALESGELPDMLQKAVDEGRMTQEQAEQAAEMMQSGNFSMRIRPDSIPSTPGEDYSGTPPIFGGSEGEGVTPPDTTGELWPSNGNSTYTMVTSSGDFQLREGLTVTVSIYSDSRTNVLLVPSGAVHTDSGINYVTVVNTDGTREERAIVIGLNDWQNTEVISGLSEGEQVAYIPTNDSSSESDFGGMFMAPGGGGGVVVRSEGIR